jgi:hypothetical protein
VVAIPEHTGPVIGFWAGDRWAAALTSTHEIYTWGETHFGQGGHGHTDIPQPTPKPVSALDGARLTAIYGGASHALVTADCGPAVALRVTPRRQVVRVGEQVTYRIHAVDAFDTDLGAAQELGLGPLALQVGGGYVVGTTVRPDDAGLHSVTARLGGLVGTATLIVEKGN